MFNPPAFYFDSTSRKCQTMNYGGCKGNDNRFATKDECENTCKEYMVSATRSNDVSDTEFAKKCEPEKAPGKCRGFQKKYFHNKNAKKCQEFIYTGCQGNENNYDSLDECEATCGVVVDMALKAGKDPKCNKPVMVGRCRSRLEKYYYDQNTGLCKTFYYSGCRGGSNMFDNINDCVQTCVQQEQLKRASLPQDLYVSSPCEQEKAVGPCRAKKSRWHFNKVTQNCEQFQYSGCRGNDNNFETQTECQAECQPMPNGRSTQINISPFDVPFTTLPEIAPERPMLGGQLGGGCPGCPSPQPITPEIKMVAAHGAKKFSGYSQLTGGECEHVKLNEILDVKTQVVAGTNYIFSMKLDIKSGPNCETKTQRTCSNIHIHKPLTCRTKEDLKTCLEIIRDNGIKCGDEDSLVIPEIMISPATKAAADPCMQDKAVGRCKASFPRFYFDKDTKSCKAFNYGGCMGNENNFADQSSCEEVCSKHLGQNDRTPRQETRRRPTPKNQICKMAMDAGPCFALMPRFYFNFATRRCEEFLYGGCKGNANNFQTMQECISGCGKHPRSAPFPPLLPPLPKCKFGDNSYAIGDIVRLDGDKCKSCICSSPPDLTCTIKACTMRAFFQPRGGVNCVMEKDDFGCCDIGYKCESITPQSPSFGGSYPVLGGYGSEPIEKEVKMLAAKATKKLLTTVTGVTGDECSHAQLLEILEVKRQIVAGTNFKLKLKLRTKSGSGCSDEIVRVCENIVVFKPLPFACLPTPEDEECLTLTRPEEITCS